MIQMPFYAVANGRTNGVFLNWNECKESVNGYKNAIYKKFNTQEEADDFINSKQKGDNRLSLFDISKSEKKDDVKFNTDYYVYTDGACSNNGRENAISGIGIFFDMNDVRNVSKKINGKQTNNTAELSAIVEAYYIIESDIIDGKNITIVSDSEYAIKCVGSYGEKCCNKSWNISIPNKELVKTAYELYANKSNVQFIYVKAHTNNGDKHSVGNYNADKLARDATKN
jgi:ribonuclease HI